jgi:hypothetical protein
MNRTNQMLAFFAIGSILFTGVSISDRSLASPKPSAHPLLAAQESDTETVLSTLRARVGSQDELQKTLAQEWSTLRKLGPVLAEPHVLPKGKGESGKTIFVEVFTWRDHETPDHVPPEVRAIWKHLES